MTNHLTRTLAVLLMATTTVFAQKKPIQALEQTINRNDIEPPLTFLAADEMKGRDTGSEELNIAANYIASQFQSYGVATVPGAQGYFQPVSLLKRVPVQSGTLTVNGETLAYKEQFLVINGIPLEWSGDVVYVGYGAAEDLTGDLKGKLVVAMAGSKDSKNAMDMFMESGQKNERVSAAGAAGLVEIFAALPFPWAAVVNYFGGSTQFGIQKGSSALPHIWLKNAESPAIKALREAKSGKGAASVKGVAPQAVPAKNVVGLVMGTDPKLKNEYIVISGHYDHVGIGAPKAQDSIYNGARDNALGTVAVLNAARFFAKYPAKRSIIFMALTGEEKGLLGSDWYAEHPLVPLAQTVFNMDCDGAGYNDTSVVTVIGMEKTNAGDVIGKACTAFGLKAALDPVPEQNLYERSDNYNFAKMGIPAVDFAPGIKSFDAELMKYYHQPADEAGTLDWAYLLKYYRAFVYANWMIANGEQVPFWKPGDKFEAKGKALYGKP